MQVGGGCGGDFDTCNGYFFIPLYKSMRLGIGKLSLRS